MTGFTESLISQIENQKANPSVSTLVAISHALGVPISIFFEEDGAACNPVIRSTDRAVVRTANGVSYYQLNRHPGETPIEVLWAEYEGGSSTGKLISHEGTECGIVLSGKLEVRTETETYVLNSGDSITLDSSVPHMLTNLSNGLSTAIWINSPPSF